MRHFWALPAVLRIALASPHSFSVFDDLLAFPQYEVIFPNTFITEAEATSLLTHSTTRSTTSATPNSQETQELSRPGKQAPSSSSNSDAVLDETYEAVVLAGQRYLCSIPMIPEEQPHNSSASAEQVKAEEEKELMRATDRGWELLEGMHGNCIYYVSGWWSYSFCYKEGVKQFHQLPPSRGVPIYPPVEDTTVKSFILGKFSEKGKKPKGKDKAQKTLGGQGETKDESDSEVDDNKLEDKYETAGLEVARLENKGGSRYMVQRLGGGTECDLTGKARRIEVQFHCNPQSPDRISMIKETATCSYLMIIDTPRLCGDVAFLPPQENFANAISCQAVVSESDVDLWTSRKLEEKIAEAERLVALENNNPLREMQEGAEGSTKRGPVVGGIEVGAQALVGSEGKVIEKSVVVGGGKEVYVGTVATSTGEQMSKEEMRKLEIRDPRDVEKLKKDLQKLAGRKGWKLELVDTPRGREFRGIIEVDDEEDNKEKESDSKSPERAKGTGKGMRKEDEGDQEPQDGSEEVYKDEL